MFAAVRVQRMKTVSVIHVNVIEVNVIHVNVIHVNVAPPCRERRYRLRQKAMSDLCVAKKYHADEIRSAGRVFDYPLRRRCVG